MSIQIKKAEQRFTTYKTEDSEHLLISYGSQARIAFEAIDILRKQNIKAGLFRPISLWPYPQKGLKKEAKNIKDIYVIEQSLGQMVEDVRLALPQKEIHFFGKAGGGVPSVLDIIKFVKKNI